MREFSRFYDKQEPAVCPGRVMLNLSNYVEGDACTDLQYD